MNREAVVQLAEVLSAAVGPLKALDAEQRHTIDGLFEAVDDELTLTDLGTKAAAALAESGENLRAHYALAMYQELAGEAEEAGRGFHHIARELAAAEDWAGAREMALRALPLRPDYRTVRLLMSVLDHLEELEDGQRGQDLAVAHESCPDSPDLLWLEAQRADAVGNVDEAERLAGEALNQFVAHKETDRAEEPLLRVLESHSVYAYRDLLKTIPRMVRADLPQLLDTTLELAASGIEQLGLQGELAGVLERILTKRNGFEHLRPLYVQYLVKSLGGTKAVDAFVRDCGVADPDIPLQDALAALKERFNVRPGAFVEHTNFGVGRIVAHDEQFLVIDFKDKPKHRMAREIARRSLRTLPDGCLRVARFVEPEQIAHEIASDPAALLVRALTDLGGEAKARDLRECLAGTTVPEDHWSTWWKKAREAAQDDDRVDTSQAFRQVYRLPGEGDDDEVELPPLPARGGPQSIVTLIERLLRQHPELEQQARAHYGEELANRALGAGRDGVAAVPTLMRWMPERAAEWTELGRLAVAREPGVSAGVTAPQQQALLEIGLQGDGWKAAALTAISSRFPPVRDRALTTLRQRLGDQFEAELTEVLLDWTDWPNARLAIARLALSGTLTGVEPWDLLAGVLGIMATSHSAKLVEAALDMLEPQGKLTALVAQAPPPEGEQREHIQRAIRQVEFCEAGVQPLLLVLDETPHKSLREELGTGALQEEEAAAAIAIHFEPGVLLMTRLTYEQNNARIRDLQHQLATAIPREIAAARALGDLKENAEYHAARERQGIADVTLRSLQSQMESARVIDDIRFPPDTVVAGTQVRVRDLSDGSERNIWLLGQGDSVQDNSVINYLAPLGQALVGKKAGDVVELNTGASPQRLEVLSVERRLPGK